MVGEEGQSAGDTAIQTVTVERVLAIFSQLYHKGGRSYSSEYMVEEGRGSGLGGGDEEVEEDSELVAADVLSKVSARLIVLISVITNHEMH